MVRSAGSPGAGSRDTALRDRVLERAAELTGSENWSAVTMARLAAEVGVSRQTVYNEVGGKPQLAEALVLRELGVFLAGVDTAFRDRTDMVDAIRAASRSVLEQARVNPLLRAILSSTHGADSDLLPLLTTHSGALLATAREVIRGHLTDYELGLTEHQLDAAIDMVVRLMLSHVMQPTGTPDEVAGDIAWIAARVLQD